MNIDELNEILRLHKKWLNNEEDGKKANLRGADLKYVTLRDADLRDADLRYTNLWRADLRYANLRGADLRYANLRGADLKYADLRYADLRGADLRGAILDYSCLPLWCGSLRAHMDDRQVIQLLYHTLSIVKNSKNVSYELKEKLLTDVNLEIANRFHRVDECGKIEKEV